MKIAAGIVVLMAIGLYFIRPEHTVVALHAKADHTIDSEGERVINHNQPTTVDYTESPVVADVQTPVKHRESKLNNSVNAKTVTNNADAAQNGSQYVAAVEHSGNDNNGNIAQTATIQNTNEGLVPETIISNPVKAVSVLPVKNSNPVMASITNTKTEPVKKHKIHSLGDLLNVVIAKVDKREDKLIEFTNTNDEDSFTVTGVNLGLLKAKKEK